MPFTFEHPAAVLPLGLRRNRYVDFSAAVVGTMAPDFEYFIHFRPFQTVGHTILGQFYFNLPLIFMAAFIFHNLIKEAVISNLPSPYCERYAFLKYGRWKIDSLRSPIVFCYSALFGAFTHIFWDGFTHSTGFFVESIELLSNSKTMLGRSIPVYKLMQHGSTLMGFFLIAAYIILIQDKSCNFNQSEKSKDKLYYCGFTIILALTVDFVYFTLISSLSIGAFSINGVFIGIVISAILWRIKRT
ncbi:protein of unknown function [Peptoclostridium litorale DSM 5388]|uniref:Putative membrane protein n=1 Tax=Peptoclostridium litorale DSM 5388 TaxID=1121324 RepID=A0A069RDJ4_PEPLI|nr:DUF4184 family protein [Peptoclostridium litorale]KDR95114.1 putative membrane protein [Peptoclostridium litorale DSM 5388]SIN74795.1 protein of unknown function [Peptoclostridium litorale DSM 5388]